MGLDVTFCREKKKIPLPREAATKAWKAGDRAKEYMAIPDRAGDTHTRGLDKEIYHLPRKSQAKIY